LAGIISTVLSDRLLEVKREGLYPKNFIQKYPQVEYRMTLQASELEDIINELGKRASLWKSPQLHKTKLE
jgi:DNA-binding HxlR family transcriptional regulator